MERERKYRLTQAQAARLSAQLKLEAKPQHAGTDRDTFFDHPALSLEVAGRKLRVRQRETTEMVEVTHKGPERLVGLDKLRTEVTVEGISSALLPLLRELGFVEIRSFAKQRHSYRLDGVEVALDLVPDLGWFCELEALGDDADLDACAARLALRSSQLEGRSYSELIRGSRRTRRRRQRPR